MSFQRLPIDPDTYYTDVAMFGQEKFGAVYLIDDERVALIETGTSHDVAAVVTALDQFGRKPEEVDVLVVSHIHLDHAGGAGFLLDLMPRAKVYVHAFGEPHLHDPSRLLASAQRALQDMAEAFGTMRPIRTDRLVAIQDGDELDLGQRQLTFYHAHGHAPHELVIFDSKNRCLYTGDEAGLWLPDDGFLMPLSTPPSFDLETNLASLRRMLRLEPRALLFSHFGPHLRPQEAIEQQLALYPDWSSFVRSRLGATSEDGMVDELYALHAKGVRTWPAEFLKERMRNSVNGLVVYHRRMERAAP
jgi:glyoxylase-like metal-dependent hydrolase (beta-lactamase superfamily II)